MTMHRRAFLAAATTTGVGVFCSGSETFAQNKPSPTMGLGFSLYGMKSLALIDALKACSEIGYDCVEIPVMPDWPADSMRITPGQQKQLRESLATHKLRLSALMENLPLLSDEKKHAGNLERLKAAGELAHALSPDLPIPVETVLGGAPSKWPELKRAMVERLGMWAKVAASTKTVIAIKAHVSNALHTPADARWLVEEVGSPWIKLAYDYSHFALQKLDMAESVQMLIPQSVFVHVKDEQGEPGKFQFLLPGEGKTDYEKLFRLFSENGYRSDVVVEVSGQIHSRPGYDPLASAKKCYASLASAFEKAGIRRS